MPTTTGWSRSLFALLDARESRASGTVQQYPLSNPVSPTRVTQRRHHDLR